MEVHVRLEFYGIDTPARESLRAFCDEQVRRALQRDLNAVRRVVVTVRRDPARLVERWTARIDVTLHQNVTGALCAEATARHPHGAVEDATLAAWSALRGTDARAAA